MNAITAHRALENTMTERHPRLRDPDLEDVAQWHPVGGPPDRRGTAGCSTGMTSGTHDLTGSGRPEGD